MIPMNSECETNILSALQKLYLRHGYFQYKMNKFEEYDLYAKNKDFLISDNIITFTDGNGKLLALKPDVTLSIVKNSKDDSFLKRVYYTENVYRMTKGTRNYKEIMQVGLECIGTMDSYTISEVLDLACESLDQISSSTVLGVSHLGILSEFLLSIGLPLPEHESVFCLIGERNLHELSAFLSSHEIEEDKVTLLSELLSIRGGAEMLPRVTELLNDYVSEKTLGQFTDVISVLSEHQNLHLDFSIVDDIRYYNGFVFKGYAEGISTAILSGGQYDKLMKKMERSTGAIGFAIYFDEIEKLTHAHPDYDVDILLMYDDSCTLADLHHAIRELSVKGRSVVVHRNIPDDLRYRSLYIMKNGKAVQHD